jgi:predicted ArsR family transcriptional regulator
MPPRRYELAARLRAEGHEDAGRTDGDPAGEPGTAPPGELAAVPPGVAAAGARHGRRLGLEARRRAGRRPSRRAVGSALIEVLGESGYAPVEVGGNEIRFTNCPFDALVADHRDLVCGMNLTVADGLLAELGDGRLTAALEPRDGFCCVAIRPAAARA